MNGLMLHAGSKESSIFDLAAVPVPADTATYKAVPHYELVNRLVTELESRNIGIVKTQFGLNHEGAALFGLLELSVNAPGQDFAMLMGIRNSYDKTLTCGVVAGARVFVCDNLMFQGDFVALNRKHTPGFILGHAIPAALDRFQSHFEMLVGTTDRLKGIELADSEAKSLIHDVMINVMFPGKLFPEVSKAYFKPAHEEFAPRTAWSVYNAFTEAAKGIKGTATRLAKLGGVTDAFRKLLTIHF